MCQKKRRLFSITQQPPFDFMDVLVVGFLHIKTNERFLFEGICSHRKRLWFPRS